MRRRKERREAQKRFKPGLQAQDTIFERRSAEGVKRGLYLRWILLRTFGAPSGLTPILGLQPRLKSFLRFAPFHRTAAIRPPDLNLASPSASCYRPIAPERKQILRPLPRLADYATVFRNARTQSQRCHRAWSETLADSSICLHRRNERGHRRAGETSDI